MPFADQRRGAARGCGNEQLLGRRRRARRRVGQRIVRIFGVAAANKGQACPGRVQGEVGKLLTVVAFEARQLPGRPSLFVKPGVANAGDGFNPGEARRSAWQR